MSDPEVNTPTLKDVRAAVRYLFDKATRLAWHSSRGVEVEVTVPEEYSNIRYPILLGNLNLQQINQPSTKVLFIELREENPFVAVFEHR